jgi:hypothetical protein
MMAIVDVRSLAEFQGDRFWPSGAPSHRVAPGTFPPPYTCRSTTSATTEAGSVPSMNSASSLHRSPQRPRLRRILGRMGPHSRCPGDCHRLQSRVVIHTRLGGVGRGMQALLARVPSGARERD